MRWVLSSIISIELLDTHSALQNPWFIVAAVAFSASNRPEAVPRVFEQALQDLRGTGSDKSQELLLARKMREALFKSGLISGYPKVRVDIFASQHKWITDCVDAGANYRLSIV